MSDYEQLKRCAVKAIWKRRKELTPRGITWERWWEGKFGGGLTLDEFVKEVRNGTDSGRTRSPD